MYDNFVSTLLIIIITQQLGEKCYPNTTTTTENTYIGSNKISNKLN